MAGEKRKREGSNSTELANQVGSDSGNLNPQEDGAVPQPKRKRKTKTEPALDGPWDIGKKSRARVVHDGEVSKITMQRGYTKKELTASRNEAARIIAMRSPGPRASSNSAAITDVPARGLPANQSERNIKILLDIHSRTTAASSAKAELGAALKFNATDRMPLPSVMDKKKRTTISKKNISIVHDDDEGKEEDEGELTWRRSRQLDLTQPPISDVHEIFKLIALKAQELGFNPTEILGKDVDLRVFTMCSGTEAPIIAMDMIGKAQRLLELDTLNFRHLGSAEIEPEKQAFIERNFKPPFLFRDVTEFTTHSKDPDDPDYRPYTAYGAQVDPPRRVHMLIAGSSCVDFSNLNSNRPEVVVDSDKKDKSRDAIVGSKEAGVVPGGDKQPKKSKSESASTFAGVRDYAKVYRPNLILMENVESAGWDEFSEAFKKIGYRLQVVHVDSINYYVPQTRNRTYALVIDVKHAENIKFDYEGVLHEWANLMAQFQRRASSPYSDFLLSESDQRFLLEKKKMDAESRPPKQSDWTSCRKRHTDTRNREQLGNAAPYTGMKENPVIVMDDSAWQRWVVGQAKRVQDALDINFLRYVAQRGFDMRYKHRNFNFTQNVDRDCDSREWGVVGCLTPSGGLFDTLRGGPITGIEALHLQGMPIGNLNLNKESSRLLQDLAGNAMTVTVVGVAIISALIACLKQQKASQGISIFQAHTDLAASEPLGSTDHRNRVLELKSEEELAQGTDDAALESAFESLSLDNDVSLQEITHSARESQPYCHCEGLDQHVSTNLRLCPHCFYTCCSSCNRKDHDGLFEFSLDTAERSLARDFVHSWTQKFPPVLEFDLSDVDMEALASHCLEQGMQLSDYMMAAFQGTMRFGGIKYDSSWRVTYESYNARLELDIVPRHSHCTEDHPTGGDILKSLKLEPTWLLFAKAKPDEPAGSSIRDTLRYPVAKMQPTETILSGDWQVRVAPQPKADTKITIKGTGNVIPAWESTLGLDIEMFDIQQVFTGLHIGPAQAMIQESPSVLENILGKYEQHQKCPAASGSLYTMTSTKFGTVFLYLDSNPFQESVGDRMVLSTQPPKQGRHDDRSILAMFDRKWRPTLVNRSGTEIKCDVFDEWKPINAIRLAIPKKEQMIKKWHQPKFPANQDTSCTESSSIFVIEIPLDPRNREKWPQGHTVTIELEDKAAALKDFGWILKYAAEIPCRHSVLQPIANSMARKCSTCLPAPPSLEWVFKKGHLKACESKKEATRFEQQLKERPKPAQAMLHCHGDSALLDIQLNITTMAHRATALHSEHKGKLLDSQWHIENYNHLASNPKFRNIKISSNVSEAMTSTSNIGHRTLWKSQREVLAWMQQCEEEPQPWNELAQVECRLPSLQCRVEVKSLLQRNIRGGVVADDVGAGKTTTSLALIGLDYERLARGEAFTTECPSGLIETQATLIFIPKNIMQQWVSEIKQCLPSWNWQDHRDKAASVKQPYYIVLKSAKELAQCSVERLKGAHLVLVPLTLFQEEPYWDNLQNLVCAPHVPSNPGRAFQEWLSQALTGLASLTPELLDVESQFWKKWEELNADKSSYERFHVLEAPKTRKSNREDMDKDEEAAEKAAKKAAEEAATEAAAGAKKFEDRVHKFKEERKIPTLLHMLQFRRVIIDEFTYIEGRTLLAILELIFSSMWLLSGTPPIHDFDGLNTMAKLMGTRISTYNENEGKFGFGSDGTKMAKDKSDAQEFRSFETIQSAAYKQAMYDHAAAFAEVFMRKNKPAVSVGKQITHEYKCTLTPSEVLAQFDVEVVLNAAQTKFNQRMTAPKWEILRNSPYDTKLRVAVQELSGPEAARVCASAILHKIVEVVPKGAQAYEEDILKALINDHEQTLLDHAGELFERLRDLWYGAKHHKPVAEFRKLTQDVKAEIERATDMLPLLDRLLWQAKTASTDTPPTVRVSAYTDAEKANANLEGKKPEDIPYDFEKLSKTVQEKEMLIRMDKVTNMIVSLSEGFGRLRLLKTILALIRKESPEICSRCERPLDSVDNAEISMTCGHIIACSRCFDEPRSLEDPDCCGLFLDTYASPVSSFLLSQNGEAEVPSPGMKGSMMQKAVRILQNEVGALDSAVVFIQFAKIKDAFVEACKATNIVCLDGFVSTERQVKNFQEEAEKGAAVLVLKVDSQDAAGWNLQVANHVLFLGDMVGLGKEEKAATIEQAVGRCRRPGQEKGEVHVYHLAA
ncbi:hypothetical protein LTR10_023615 [Elasticomyces elasticus]|uniref:Helicase ATP-binding domain-containing protein n=1 Tax=Exophiala sideris TaxID=1016849 RepID=A0ABR0J8C9_9EURO|nr:hypothetical protein LTR10_023615 [Elasticomyces elasticus]KAK5025465.1 hypothetical protein LTR13_010429 [Exophiala sideris]KAK5029737.1 hypothetical protein LTS07_005461 [Exophiala sideris]KAK5058501.1 hypothetical protein LTR69_006906 [Exophiala sideris]KAK5178526.1 hypothetical protein LTR44_008897 [Eurotiomycetes sp. CCFEE 6388]